MLLENCYNNMANSADMCFFNNHMIFIGISKRCFPSHVKNTIVQDLI